MDRHTSLLRCSDRRHSDRMGDAMTYSDYNGNRVHCAPRTTLWTVEIVGDSYRAVPVLVENTDDDLTYFASQHYAGLEAERANATLRNDWGYR